MKLLASILDTIIAVDLQLTDLRCLHRSGSKRAGGFEPCSEPGIAGNRSEAR